VYQSRNVRRQNGPFYTHHRTITFGCQISIIGRPIIIDRALPKLYKHSNQHLWDQYMECQNTDVTLVVDDSDFHVLI
jgi:hypothetical protein